MTQTQLPNEDMLLDHDYDEIQEYDNPLPGWWTWLFIGSVIFTLLYIPYFHGIGPSVEESYQAEVAAHVEKMLEQLGDIQADNATILEFMDNDEWMGAVKGMFASNCGPCHANDGGGNVGPNLTDDAFKNVTQPSDLFTIITNGVAGTGMTAWGDRLSEPQRILLSAYVASLRGEKPTKGLPPDGATLPPWDTFLDAGEPTDPETMDDPADGEG